MTLTYFLVNSWLMASEAPSPGPIDDVLAPWLARLSQPAQGWLRGAPGALRLARDVAMLARGLRAEPRPVSRRYEAARAAPGLPGERRLRVLEVRRETAEAVSVVFERPAGLSFEAGQFLTLLLPVGGGLLPRSYSLSSTPAEGEPLVVTVKWVRGGAGSGYVHERLRPGQVVRARGPSGSFTYRPGAGPERLLLVGGGSGITPLMGIARAALAGSAGARVELLYANRSAGDVIFAEALAALAGDGRLRVTHFLETPGGDLPHRAGRVGAGDLAEALERAGGEAAIYLCGPGPMMREVGAAFEALGVPAGRVRVEHFHSVRPAAAAAGLGPRRLEVAGRQVAVAAGQTLLEAAAVAGVPLAFSCGMGGCGACAVRLERGEVVLDEPNCLSAAERAAGVILACVARPRTDVAVAPIAGAASPAPFLAAASAAPPAAFPADAVAAPPAAFLAAASAVAAPASPPVAPEESVPWP
ncbi:MAG TPA: ferredoxin--NADP reductase [Polyangiaceae bacterium]|nr:ferredoxin--NADP reductase [Polyangiaceae bacterium]